MDEEQEGQEPELTFPEMMLSDIAADVAKIRRNTGFLATVVLVYLVVVGLSFVFVAVRQRGVLTKRRDEDRTLRAVLVGMLREFHRSGPS